MIYFCLSFLTYFMYVALRCRKYLHMLQLNSYNNSNRYVKWIGKNIKKCFFTYDIILLFIILSNTMFSYDGSGLVILVFWLLLFFYYFGELKHEQVKIKFVVTSRIKRLIFTLFVIYLLPTILIVLTFDESLINLYTFILFVMVHLSSILVYLANIFNVPAEKYVYHHFKKMASSKLKKMNNLKVIGITGSYGKTSSKNILANILNVKYETLASPLNYNTPYGLIRTINENLSSFDQIFVAEMGACEVGQIKELCDLVHPRYGILTKIGIAHLDSFKTEENIRKTKFELIENLPNDGVGVLNKDDDKQVSYKVKNDCKILWISIIDSDVDVYANNIKCSHNGTTFDCFFKGDKKKYSFVTKLLGNANVYNILGALALAKELGLTTNEMIRGVKILEPTPHRLELKKQNDVYIIDDAYNSNPVGSSMALDVLGLMPGKKIVVTPGMIELKDKEEEQNEEFGFHMASVADEVILVGEKKTKAIYSGLKKKSFADEKIHIINDVKEAFILIEKLKNKETYVLFENDLPDIFNE